MNHSQLELFTTISKNPDLPPREIYKKTDLNKYLVSSYLSKLRKQGFLEKQQNKISISSNNYARLLSNLLTEDPTLKDILSNKAIQILMTTLEYSKIKDISEQTNLSIPALYPYLRKLKARAILTKQGSFYKLNQDIWPSLHDFIKQYLHQKTIEKFKELPKEAKIYFESPKEVVFSTEKPIAAQKTAFSSFNITLYMKEFFYRLPKKQPDKTTILSDSLRIAKDSVRRKIYSFLFYKKNKIKINHPDITTLNKIFKGEIITEKGFPTRQELMEKCKDYDIRI